MEYSIQLSGENGSVSTYSITCGGCIAQGIAITVPGEKGQILAINCNNGMLFCRIFDAGIADKLDLPAAVFSAPTIADMLKNKPVALSAAAERILATKEMTGLEIIKLFS